VFIWYEDRWYVAYEPTGGVSSQGRTVDEALDNTCEALELYLEENKMYIPSVE